METSYSRGWKIYYDGENWRYCDNDKVVDNSRPCAKCGKPPTPEGYDACLGHIEGAISACCGHGVFEPYVRCTMVTFLNDPFDAVMTAFRNLYPDKEFVALWGEPDDPEAYGETFFPDEQGEGWCPHIYVSPSRTPAIIAVEVLAHELAHVAVGAEHKHNEVFEKAFDDIFAEYNKLSGFEASGVV